MSAREQVSRVLASRTTDAVAGGLIVAIGVAAVGYLGLIVLELFFATGNGLSEPHPLGGG